MSILNIRAKVQAKDQQGNLIEMPAGSGLQRLGPRVIVTLSPLEAQLKNFTDKAENPPNTCYRMGFDRYRSKLDLY